LAQSSDVECVFLSRRSPLPDIGYQKIQPVYWMEELQPDTYFQIIDFCREKAVDCVVVGTADAMIEGLVDALTFANIRVVGANKKSSIVEASKCFSKRFFDRQGVSTPKYYTCQSTEEIITVDNGIYPCFIKSDKVIRSHYSAVKVNSKEEAVNVAIEIFSIQQNYYGFSTAVILEELCEGRELSLTILMSGENWVELPACRDYKTLNDNDNGGNTSGMGAITPVPGVSSDLHRSMITSLVQPVVAGMVQEGLHYNGFLYFGIMIDANNGPVLLELNCRLGDPEGQAICSLLTSDFASVLFSVSMGQLQKNAPLSIKPGYICCVYAVPKSYPEKAGVSFSVNFSETFESAGKHDFYFGELLLSDHLNTIMTYNNRTFCVSAWGGTLSLARQLAYQKLHMVLSDGLHYRNDIGVSVIKGEDGR
jgi:phosphoribosylamine--glycine ligase